MSAPPDDADAGRRGPKGGRWLVRMSDLVRGIHRGGGEPPEREAEPPARASAPPPAEREPPSRAPLRFPSETARPTAPEPLPAAPEAPAGPEQLLVELLAFTGRLPGLVREGREFPWGWYQRLVERAIVSLEGSEELFWLGNDIAIARAEYLPAHLTQVGILSLQIGRRLGYDREHLLDLGLAAFLFDVGLTGLPEGLQRKAEPLAGGDLAAYQGHVQLSAETVRRWAPPRAGVVEAVLHHHERENGRGYPQGLAGSAIHPNAKLIGLVDTYTPMVFPRPPGRRVPPHEAIREIVRSKHEDFPPPLIKALLTELSVFPPRTMVRLNTGEVGRVIAVNRDHPLRPRVRIEADSKGHPLAVAKILDLSEAPFVYVTGPVREEEP